MGVSTFAFITEHNGQNLIFDLGVRKDWETSSPPSLINPMRLVGWIFEVDKDVSDAVQNNGTSLESIDAIIWRYAYDRTRRVSYGDKQGSHHHTTHTGNHSTFPSKTSLAVGPGFEHYLPRPILTTRSLSFLTLLTLVAKSERF